MIRNAKDHHNIQVNTFDRDDHLWRSPSGPAQPPVYADPVQTQRDASGRFLTGNSGGGRPKGAKNKLTEVFLSAVARDFAEYGPSTIERLRNDDPASYLRIIVSLLPRDLILKFEEAPAIDFADLSDQEVNELLRIYARRQEIEAMLKQVGHRR